MGSNKFNESLKRGKRFEDELDCFFFEDWGIHRLSPDQEKRGLGDRVFINKKTGQLFFIEYKTDEKAYDTGNFFIETISVDRNHQKGWALTCLSDFIFFYIPRLKEVYIVDPKSIRDKLDQWQRNYPVRPSRDELNNNYVSYGVCVPIKTISDIAIKTVHFLPEIDQKVNDIIESGFI